MRGLWCVVMVVALAGCLSPAGDPVLDVDDEGLKVQGLVLVTPDGAVAQDVRGILEAEGECPCDGLDLSVRVPDSVADLVERLFVTVAWDGTKISGLDFTSSLADERRRGHDAERLTFEAPVAEDIPLEIEGEGAYTLRARLVFSDGDEGRLLPNLITTTPGDFRMPPEAGSDDDPLKESGCNVHDERLEDGAQRCLRFGNAPGNVGQGPLEVRMMITQGPFAIVDEGRFIQRVLQEDGTWEDQLAAGGTFHVTHAHLHYVGFSDYRLFAYDLETGLRGAQVSDSNKVGFCPIDSEPVPDSEVEPDPETYSIYGCWAPGPEGWYMGISKGYADVYVPGLSGQYIEISGVEDGVYQLVSTVDVDDTLEEEDEQDNSASVVLEIRDGGLKVLEEFSFYGPTMSNDRL